MPLAGQTYPGAFREGRSFLHRFDPRLKLLLLCGLMICLFSATGGWRLLLLFLAWLAAVSCIGGWRESARVFRLLRWLLLCTLMLHLLLTPGRTLFGTSWLSYDGLLRGLLVDSQLLLAVLFSMLLARTTRPELLAWGIASLLSPLQRLKLPVREAGGLLQLVLQFFPLIRSEVALLQSETDLPQQKGLAGIASRAALVRPLLLRLVDRADRIALDIASGDQSQATITPGEDRRLTHYDWALFGCGLVFLMLSGLV